MILISSQIRCFDSKHLLDEDRPASDGAKLNNSLIMPEKLDKFFIIR